MLNNLQARFFNKVPVWRNPKVSHLMQMQQPMDVLNNKHFIFTLLLAMALHMVCYGIWSLIPKAQVVDIPVRALNIKLGDGDMEFTQEEMSAIKPTGTNSSDVEHIISRAVSDQAASSKRKDAAVKTMEKVMATDRAAVANPFEKPNAKIKSFDMRSEGVTIAAPVQQVEARQFVRDLPAPEGEASKASLSESAKAEVVVHFEQLVSAWIDKFKPEKMLSGAQSGKGVAKVRFRIDRRGNIRYIALDQSSESAVLDRAALDTVRRANPVPPVPIDYPAGDLIEFIVPVTFTK